MVPIGAPSYGNVLAALQFPRLMCLSRLCFFSALMSVAILAEAKRGIGVNYGQLGDNLPSPEKAVELIKAMKVGSVKIYGTTPEILQALADSEIKVSVMVPNQNISALASNYSAADEWIENHVSAFYSRTKIRTVLVGNEILSDYSIQQTWFQLVPAMINLHTALRKRKLHHIKVSTPHAMDILENGAVFPPSNGTFRLDIQQSVMKPLLRFLDRTRSPLFLDIYPFLLMQQNPNISLEFAVFDPHAPIYRDIDGLEYKNLLDVQLDAVLAAMRKLGYKSVKRTLSETGWPTKGDLDQRGANIYNAALYNRRAVRKLLAKPALGTPARPGESINTYIFALFNEDLKPGPTTERNWGLLYPNGSHVYEVDLTGELTDSQYRPLPVPPPEPAPGTFKLWCVANPSIDTPDLQAALSYACGQGSANCSALQQGHPCFLPNNIVAHASYAFNDYYNKFKKIGGTCNFNGAANLTTMDPSHGSCRFPPTYV